ncbi:MAG: YggS family pyridoxal phosphate-dependent enzyme [Leucobacter sp.]
MAAPEASEHAGLAERLAEVRGGIADACRSASRDPESVALIVVTKFHPASLVAALAGLGVRDVGENRHQEARAKAEELAALDLRWHFIGQLQSKKARQVAAYAHAIHSIDREAVIDPLDRLAEEGGLRAPVDAFMQINLTDDPGRGGVPPESIEALAERMLAAPSLRLRGVMAVAPLDEEPARAFERLAGYSSRVRALDPSAEAISAGMTHDYAEAIAHGATHLRIGSAITGKRPEAG